jgi:hypothetical protein
VVEIFVDWSNIVQTGQNACGLVKYRRQAVRGGPGQARARDPRIGGGGWGSNCGSCQRSSPLTLSLASAYPWIPPPILGSRGVGGGVKLRSNRPGGQSSNWVVKLPRWSVSKCACPGGCQSGQTTEMAKMPNGRNTRMVKLKVPIPTPLQVAGGKAAVWDLPPAQMAKLWPEWSNLDLYYSPGGVGRQDSGV